MGYVRAMYDIIDMRDYCMNLAIVKSGNNKRLYIQRSFRKDGKSSSKNVECLGNLNDLMESMKLSEDEVLAWGRKKAKEYTDKEVKENKQILVKLDPTKRVTKSKLQKTK